MNQKIFIIVPKLIEQTTWGGRYILEYKGWQNREKLKELIVGQSYELFSGSKVRTDIKTTDDKSFIPELGLAEEPDKTAYFGDKSKLIELDAFIAGNPEKVLGKRSIKKFGKKLKTLIKFTQARGNSFQLHVKESSNSAKWKFKPESWYYFEPGLATLGAVKNINWQKYKNACEKIDDQLKKLSVSIKNKSITAKQAKKIAETATQKYNPRQYVNRVKVKKDQIIDLSPCGIHHSWEEDNINYKHGNIVYEVQLDVMDPISTIRCFDNGKIKDDGSVRELQIQEYFNFVDRSRLANNPDNHIKTGKVLVKKQDYKELSLMSSKYYSLNKIIFRKSVSLQTNGSFNHLFVKSGKIAVKTENQELTITKGHSCFITAEANNYQIISKNEAEVLKTFV